MGQMEKVALAYIYYHVQSGQLVRSYCVTQGAQPGALRQPRGVRWGGGWDEGSRRRETCIYLWLIHADVWQKPTQYCIAIILQLKINKLNF